MWLASFNIWLFLIILIFWISFCNLILLRSILYFLSSFIFIHYLFLIIRTVYVWNFGIFLVFLNGVFLLWFSGVIFILNYFIMFSKFKTFYNKKILLTLLKPSAFFWLFDLLFKHLLERRLFKMVFGYYFPFLIIIVSYFIMKIINSKFF